MLAVQLSVLLRLACIVLPQQAIVALKGGAAIGYVDRSEGTCQDNVAEGYIETLAGVRLQGIILMYH